MGKIEVKLIRILMLYIRGEKTGAPQKIRPLEVPPPSQTASGVLFSADCNPTFLQHL